MPLCGDIIMIHAEKVIKSLKNLSSRPVGSVTPTESNQGTFTIREPDTPVTSRDIEKMVRFFANYGVDSVEFSPTGSSIVQVVQSYR